MSRTIAAKYAGQCTACGKSFPKGTLIVWQGKGRTSHYACAQRRDDHCSQEDWQCGDTAYENQCQEACGL